MKLPTARTLEALRKEGYSAHVVEKWIPQTRRRSDLFGFIDIVAIKEDRPILGVQATSTSNISSRIAKALSIPELRVWLSCGAEFEVHGWSKRGRRGQRKLWTLSKRIITLEYLEEDK